MSIRAAGEGVIDLARGHPSTSLLAVNELSRATTEVFNDLASPSRPSDSLLDRNPLQYGTDLGPLRVRKTFASWLTRRFLYERNVSREIDPDTIAITCGASYALANTLAQLTHPSVTRAVFMTSPAYFLAARIIQDAGYGDRMYAVEEASPSHLDLDLLETRLRELRDDDLQNSGVPAHLPGKRFRNVLYGVPTFSNPSGSTWTPATRQRVLDLARQYDMLIVTDEVYDLLSYDHPPESDPLRMVDLDHGPDAAGGVGFGNCVSNFSFSKYLGPGIRCGFIQASSAAMAAQWAAGGANHSGGATAQMTSYFIERIVASGELDNVITRLCREYADRSRVIRDALQKDLPRGSTIAGGHGGYFIWVTLPGDGRYKHTEEIAKVAAGEPYNVLALAGKNFQVPSGGNELEPDWVKRTLRLSLSWETSSQISQGVRRLCKVIADSELNPEMTR